MPSHGKQRQWQADLAAHTSVARALNEAADARCNAVLAPLRQDWQQACDAFDTAVAWGRAAAKAQHDATDPFHEMLKRAMGELRAA